MKLLHAPFGQRPLLGLCEAHNTQKRTLSVYHSHCKITQDSCWACCWCKNKHFLPFPCLRKVKKKLSYKIKSWNLKKDLRSGQQETKRELWRYWSLSDESLEVLAHKLVGLLLTPQAMITGESSTLGNLICPSQMSLIKSRLILFPAWLCTPRTTYPKQDKINMLTAEIMTDFGNLWTLFAVNKAKHLSKWMGGYS